MLNKQIFRMNKLLSLSIGMPLLVTYSHRSMIYLIWRYFLNGKGSAPSTYGNGSQAYVFRIALVSVSITTMVILLQEPIKKFSKKWLENVWESEFVIKRKLRNIDQVDGNTDNGAIEATGNGTEGGNDGELMRDLNGILNGNDDVHRGDELQVIGQGDVDMVD